MNQRKIMPYQHNPEVSRWLDQFPWLSGIHPNEIDIELIDDEEILKIWWFPSEKFVEASKIIFVKVDEPKSIILNLSQPEA